MDEFDFTNPLDIEKYSQKLLKKTFAQLIAEDVLGTKEGEWDTHIDEYLEKVKSIYPKTKDKGDLGKIVEKHFFHYEPNSNPNPDFEAAQVELKTTPYRINKDKTISAKERLVISKIGYHDIVKEDFETSHFWKKANLILLLYYLYSEDIVDKLNYRIDYSRLFHPPAEDIPTIKRDYEIIVNKIKEGKAHELSGSDTDYLEAATKAATSSDRTTQPFSDELAKPRAFAFKVGYMTSILRKYIAPGISTWNSILPENNSIPLEEYVVKKVQQYVGKSMTDLKKEFNILTNPKNLGSYLVFKILGVSGNNAEEFTKANIAVKTIRLELNGALKESMSFPTFDFKELIKETWENSSFGTYLRDTRFFFVVYRKNAAGDYILKGSQFWNIPYEDLENNVRNVWQKTIDVIKDGSSFTHNGKNYVSDMPKQKDDRVCHVRPHGIDTKPEHMIELPNGYRFPKQCFWLNRNYILSQLKKEFFE